MQACQHTRCTQGTAVIRKHAVHAAFERAWVLLLPGLILAVASCGKEFAEFSVAGLLAGRVLLALRSVNVQAWKIIHVRAGGDEAIKLSAAGREKNELAVGLLEPNRGQNRPATAYLLLATRSV